MGMKIRTRYDLTRGEVGYGASESDAIEDLLILLEENRNA